MAPGQMASAPAQMASGQMPAARPPFQAMTAQIMGPQPLDPQPPIAKGQLVMFQGFRSRPELNGKRAKVLSGGGAEGRWDCEMMGAGGGFLTVRAENLLVISTAGVQPDTARVRISPRRKSRSRSRKRRRSSSDSSS